VAVDFSQCVTAGDKKSVFPSRISYMGLHAQTEAVVACFRRSPSGEDRGEATSAASPTGPKPRGWFESGRFAGFGDQKREEMAGILPVVCGDANVSAGFR
jgi:hypothetical protein